MYEEKVLLKIKESISFEKKNIIKADGREKEKMTERTLFEDNDTSLLVLDIARANIGVAADEIVAIIPSGRLNTVSAYPE